MWDSLCFYLGTGVRWRLRRQHAAFLRGASRCRERQFDTFMRLLRLNGGSAFSSEHQLDRVRTVDEFRRALPIAGYERFSPYIDRLKNGEQNALLGPQNRLLMFALSSGTTAESKFIPITRQFLRDYRHGWQMWGIRAFDAHPELYRRHVLQITSDFDKFRTPAGIPCGNISGLAQQNQNPLVRQMYCVPRPVLKISDALARYYITLRFALADDRIGLVMTANPSTLVQLARLMDQYCESLIKDVRDGTLSPPGEFDGLSSALLKRHLKPLPERGRELSAITSGCGRLAPRDAWPELKLLGVWTGGTVSCYLPAIQELYGDVPVRDHGLSASEGRMTIPLEDGSPSGLLDIDAHYFEFIPEEEIKSEKPTVLEAHELREGGRYSILLTTSSGLYRYDIRDIVECTGFLGTTPLLKFLHKGAHVSSVTGEKLTELQVISAVSRVTEEYGIPLEHYVLSPAWADPPHYRLWLELDLGERAGAFAAAVDQALQGENLEYAEKRQTGRIGPVRLKLVGMGTWEQFARERQSRAGASAEQYKHPFLVPHLEFAPEAGTISCG